MKRLFIITSIILSISLSACAQGYKIEVEIDGIKDTTLLLGYHFGEKKFVADTAQVNSAGVAIFEGDSLLPGGMYIVILPQQTFFDILLSNNKPSDQQFGVSTSADNMLEDLKFTKSPENTAFANYQRFMSEKQKQMTDLHSQMQNAGEDKEKEQEVIKKINALDKEVKAYWDKVISENPGTFLANIIKSMKPIEFPDFNIPENAANADSLRWVKSYTFNQRHFFDNIDLTDDRLIRTPFFQNRIETYFDRVLLPIPDTVIHYGDDLIERTKSNPEMFQFMISHLFGKYQNSSIMGMDAVFVHLAEKYYLSGEVKWISESIKKRIADRVSELKPNLLGQVAANISMKDINNKTVELHSLNSKVTIVYFWEPKCSHCKKVTPQLKEIYQKYKTKGVEVFAVYTQNEKSTWTDYVNKNSLDWINVWDPTRISQYHKLFDIYSTPIIYVLDKDKKIIAKNIGIESLERFIEEGLKR